MRRLYLVLSLFFALLAACDGSASDCEPGSAECACLPSGECSAGLSCVVGACLTPTCPLGTEGCACLNETCGQTASQEPLSCTAGVCQLEACPAGAPGCACLNGSGCRDGAVCMDGLCKVRECIPGSEGCDCLAGGCNVGLSCAGTVCVDERGRIGGACYDNGTCDANARCDTAAFPATCVYCDLGTIGCQCDANSCLPGLSCMNGLCTGDPEIQNRSVPADPQCHTPCTENVTLADGTTLYCDADGLVPGCLDGLVCQEGECTEAGSSRKVCVADAQCPDFMQCIRGYCYSNCEVDTDCEDGLGCHLKVCRQSCAAGADDCPDTMLCDAPDGELGYCMPRASESNEVTPTTPGRLSVNQTDLRFSNVSLVKTFDVVNESDEAIRVTLTKSEHILVDDTGNTETKRLSEMGSCSSADCPLWWVQMGPTGDITADNQTVFTANANCARDNSCPRITVRLAPTGVSAVRWRGAVQLESELGTETINLSYVARAEGQWAGKMVYFANFEDQGIDTSPLGTGWLDRDRATIEGRSANELEVTNGLIKAWGAFRNGNMGGGWPEMAAILEATESEQWRWPSVVDECTAVGGACYLFSDGAVGGFPRTYVDDLLGEPIPAGSTVFPMAFNVYSPDPTKPTELKGRVASEEALHYPGNPAVTLRFAADPGDDASCAADVQGHCVVFLQTATNAFEEDGLELEVDVGARYPKRPGQTCVAGFAERTLPWLVPGFEEGTETVAGFPKQKWCVDLRLPNFKNPIDDILPEIQVENRSLARGNPIPNGDVIRRHVRLLDGAMIDQSRIFLLFRETYPSFLGGESLKAYGYMILERRPVDIDRADDNGNSVPDAYEGALAPGANELVDLAPSTELTCSAEVLADLNLNRLTTNSAPIAVARLINGGTGTRLPLPTGTVAGCSNGTQEEVHYLCEETGLFNGGADNVSCWGSGGFNNHDGCSSARDGVCSDGGAGSSGASCAFGADATDCGNRYRDSRVECPLESNVTFFTAPTSEHARITGHACQDTGTCGSVLSNWSRSGAVVTQVNPVWNCDGGASSCDEDPLDRRAGKVFYPANATDVGLTALRPALADAFRYRTRFVNREGTSLGFTPSVCQPIANAVPYCYDPEEIEAMRARTDCLLHIYETYFDDAERGGASDDTLYTYLEESFAVSPAVPGERSREGFEKLYSELLIMLGDQSYTNAFESRFDLAGIGTAGFQGAEFEDDGINVSGIAGYEMFTLHQAVQYYSMVLDRFYGISSVISAALDSGTVGSRSNFLSSDTVTVYFDRLIRASTQRSRAWAEIARRYQGFNRADLARRVATRAYNATYLESIALTNTILRLYELSEGANRPELLVALEKAQQRYSMALLDLSNVYRSITDDVNILGFAPDYVPFPALGTGGANIDINAFERIYQFTQNKLESARRREDAALAQTREFDSDDASFQAELTRLNRTYESQLSEICGLFTGVDGNTYPATRQYAYLDDVYALYGDPCGYVGNGSIHSAIVNLDIARVEVQRVMREIDNVYERARIQQDRVDAVCEITNGLAQLRFQTAKGSFSIEEDILRSQEILEAVQKGLQTASSVAQTLVCEGLSCPAAVVASKVVLATGVGEQAAAQVQQAVARDLREEKAELESATALAGDLSQCEIAQAELIGETRSIMLSLRELELTLLAAQLRMTLALSEASKLRAQAERIQLEQEEAIGLAVNVQAARNNPNVRIYRNDAVLNAELSFQDALREAYRLTLVYEYYTSQSYAAREQLFLTRMVSFGDYNLDNYVADLRNAFLSFEEQFGNPDLRVTQISLVDDILQVPRVDDQGLALSADERAARMRERILNPRFLNRDGYISLPFSTRLEEVSPITRNHKIFYVEANVEGNDNGDFIGRVYLQQKGTSSVQTIAGGQSFFRFPNRTAVINPAFNAQRPVELSSSTEVYRSYRLRDLPLVNDHWELIFNHRDEAANLDVNLNELTDIKLYVFYTDFTVY